MQIFKDYISKNTRLSDEEIGRILRGCLIRRLAHRQVLLQEGNIWRSHAFVLGGCLRTYYIDGAGLQHTVGFAVQGCWTGDRESMVNARPSAFNIDALQE